MHGLGYFLFSYLHPDFGPGLDRYDRKAMGSSWGRMWLQELGDLDESRSAVVKYPVTHYDEEMPKKMYEDANQ